MFSQDEAVKAAGNTVSFVFRTKMFGQDTAQGRLWENTDAPVLKLNFIFNTWNVLSSLFEYFSLKPGNKRIEESIFIIVQQNLYFLFSFFSFLFWLYFAAPLRSSQLSSFISKACLAVSTDDAVSLREMTHLSSWLQTRRNWLQSVGNQ